ncbi:replicative DNA helicase [Streptomyces sp. SPB4]|uniref:replicative DNA helicase n=1 Tax=Streptomyces sp. SPB4 TaxID=2940553 RepID=UPI0024770708|nr:replicative DNA helicase [Streptomyces sp. SPB4]MDH6545885.1 replicative DNA helicase [Streptomyces sp. SPB4]
MSIVAPSYAREDEPDFGAEPEFEQRFDRVPPNDEEAEASVLGGVQLSKDAIADLIEIKLKPEHFYRPKHQTIYRTALRMYADGEPVDPITLSAELRKCGELTRIGGPSYLHTLVQAVPTAANAAHYGEIVKERATLRGLVEAGTRITQMGYSAEGEVTDVVEAAQSEIFALVEQRTDDTLAPASVGMDITIGRVEARGKKGAGLTGVPTGFIDLDLLTQGFQPGQLIVIAARPAIGKSTLAMDFARAAAIKHQLATAFFSLEMGREEIQLRLLSAEGGVALHHLRSGNMTDDDWTRLAKAMPRVNAAPLFLDDAPNMSALEIRTKSRKLAQRHDLKLIVIDYLQLMESGGSRRPENRQQEVSDMSRKLKLLGKELEVPVIALSQLNRGPEQRTDKKPMLSDLRESGAIEQDADMVILLDRPDAYEKESERAGETDLIVAKHRNGPTATITVASQLHYSRFRDMANT